MMEELEHTTDPVNLEALTSPEGTRMTPEALRRTQEIYTVEGRSQIERFKEVLERGDIGEIAFEVEKAAAYMDGLYWGVDAADYGLDDCKKNARGIADLKNTFETVEDSLDRPSFGQVLLAIREGLVDAVGQACEYRRNPDLWRDDQKRRLQRGYENVSRGRMMQGFPAIDGQVIQTLVDQDLDYEEEKLKKWERATEDMKGLKNHVDARLLFDKAFSDRQRTCRDETQWMDASRSMVEPDKGHWIALYQGNRIGGERLGDKEMSEWGNALSRTEDAIEGVRWGTVKLKDDEGREIENGHDIYTNGFRTTGEFVAWVKALLPYTAVSVDADEGGRPIMEERMDVLFVAWKQSLLKGKISKLAWTAQETKDVHGNRVYRHVFGNPPFAGDLMTKGIHSEKARAKEDNWPANNAKGEIVDLDEWVLRDPKTGKVIRRMEEGDFMSYVSYASEHRTGHYRAASHFGSPTSIGRIGRLMDDYESATTLTKWKNPRTGEVHRNVSLREVAVKHGINRADPDFPWADTEVKKGDEAAGEPPSGSFGGWNLNRIRAYLVRANLIRKTPKPNELTLDFFGTPLVRMCDKLKLIKPGLWSRDKTSVPRNPFLWLMAGMLRSRSEREVRPKGRYVDDILTYRSYDSQDKVAQRWKQGAASSGIMSESDILTNMLVAGVASNKEIEWLRKNILSEEKDYSR